MLDRADRRSIDVVSDWHQVHLPAVLSELPINPAYDGRMGGSGCDNVAGGVADTGTGAEIAARQSLLQAAPLIPHIRGCTCTIRRAPQRAQRPT
jgi:hypothetical protein